MRMIDLASIVLVGLLVGCGGEAVDMGGSDATKPGDDASVPDATSPDAKPHDGTAPDSMYWADAAYVPEAESSPQTSAQVALHAAIQSACQPDGMQPQVTSVEELKQMFEGRWARCSGRGLSTDDNEEGIEFDADGKWYKLAIDQNGQWVHAGGFGAFGSWTYNENVSVEYFGITMVYADSGQNYISPQFVTGPLKMRAGWGPAPLGPSDYVSITQLP